MSMKGLFSVFQIGSRRVLRKMPNNFSSQKVLMRYIHKTAIRASATAAVNAQLQPISITKTFPTRHQSIKIAFDDNLASDFQFIWLRDNCHCDKCIHPENRQKLLDTVSLDINIKPSSYHVTDDGKLKIVWPENDGSEHISHYDPEWLHKYGKGFELDTYDSLHDNLPPMITWNAEQIKKFKPEISYREVMETEEGLKKWLEMMYKYGLVIMRGVPCEKNEVIKVTDRVSYVKKTKWGFSFDVMCEPIQTDPGHLAYTGMYLEHHTDMNYLEKSPGLQSLHCLKANPSTEGDIGGQSFFVDGFYIGKWLQNEHPSSFHTLATTTVEFKIRSHNMEYRNNQHVLCATKTGTMQEVHYNTRTMAPIQGPAGAVQPFYEAYKLMGLKMREKESEFAFNLVPGDLVSFNNRRILHGRTSFDPRRMSRHLEGCYGDIDEVITRFRTYFSSDKK